ncbi:MAG: hypothetical protein ACO1OT_19355 [Heyndrickxia sp.]
MENQPKNLFDMYKVNKMEKGFIEIHSQNQIIEKIMNLLEKEKRNQNDIILFINASLLLGTYSDKESLDQRYKELVREATERFDDIEVYNTLTDLCKICWEFSNIKFMK